MNIPNRRCCFFLRSRKRFQFQGKFRVTQDVTAAPGNVLQPIIASNGGLKITGKLRYQTCDDKICYLPETVPLVWTLKVEPLDRERAPEPIQHKVHAADAEIR
ncbi:MAG: hypothetical protein HY648_05335 [Acidobacteria bacterium]|nr:hypothetical protein [Acidobacteriota bacterium]